MLTDKLYVILLRSAALRQRVNKGKFTDALMLMILITSRLRRNLCCVEKLLCLISLHFRVLFLRWCVCSPPLNFESN